MFPSFQNLLICVSEFLKEFEFWSSNKVLCITMVRNILAIYILIAKSATLEQNSCLYINNEKCYFPPFHAHGRVSIINRMWQKVFCSNNTQDFLFVRTMLMIYSTYNFSTLYQDRLYNTTNWVAIFMLEIQKKYKIVVISWQLLMLIPDVDGSLGLA